MHDIDENNRTALCNICIIPMLSTIVDVKKEECSILIVIIEDRRKILLLAY